VHGSRIARQVLQAGLVTVRQLETPHGGPRADHSGVVLAVAGDLALTRDRAETEDSTALANAAALRPTVEESAWRS
jgi:hypothetical protein